MNVKQFSDAMGELDSRYVEEAAYYRKRAGRSGWMKWGAVAACLCLMVVGGAMLAQKSGTGAPDPDFVQIPNPVLSVASAEEMEAYLDFDVPVLDKEVGGYFVLVEEGYPTMGQIDYADGSAFRMQYGSGDISGIHGGTFEKSEEIAGVRVEYYSYNEISYAIWEQNGFTFSYEYTDNGSAEVEAIIQQFK